MSFHLDEHGLKTYAKPIDQQQLANFRMEMAKEKWMEFEIIVSHIATKNVAKEMWNALAGLY